MATATVKYFNGTQELEAPTAMRNAEFAARFPGVKGMRYDSFQMWVGLPIGAKYGPNLLNYVPIQRKISYKRFPSKHECNAKCMGGKVNGACECSCGGKNHGIGALLNAA